MSTLRVAIVAPTLGILGGQAVQADGCSRRGATTPTSTRGSSRSTRRRRGAAGARVRYLRTIVTQLTYWPLLCASCARADVVHVFSASYSSFLLAPLPAVMARAARPAGTDELSQRRSAGPSAAIARSPERRCAASAQRRAVAVPRRSVRAFDIDADVDPEHRSTAIDSAFRRAIRCGRGCCRRATSSRSTTSPARCARLPACSALARRDADARRAGSQDAGAASARGSLGLRDVSSPAASRPTEIRRYYAEADIYLQTPNIDNMPLSVLEAYASGLPWCRPKSAASGHPDARRPWSARAGRRRHRNRRPLLRLLEDPALAPARALAAATTDASYGRGHASGRRLPRGRASMPAVPRPAQPHERRPPGPPSRRRWRGGVRFRSRRRGASRTAGAPGSPGTRHGGATISRGALVPRTRSRPARVAHAAAAGATPPTHALAASSPAAAAFSDRPGAARRGRAADPGAFPEPRPSRRAPTPIVGGRSICSAIATSRSGPATGTRVDWHLRPGARTARAGVFWTDVPYLDPPAATTRSSGS